MAFTAAAESEKYARQIASSSGIAVFVAAQSDPEHWVKAGRACQRFALKATALGLKTAHINQPVEVPGLRPDLAALVGVPGRRPDLVMRLGRAPVMPWSGRRPVEAVMAIHPGISQVHPAPGWFHLIRSDCFRLVRMFLTT